jgi:hypothetical protein
MKTKDDVIEALKKEGPSRAFDVCMNIMGFHSFLDKCHLTLLEPYVPHKIFLYEKRIACKTHEGGYAAIWIGLDWIRQELTVEISPVVKDVIHIALE